MNWDQFENRMKTEISDPPVPSQQEIDASWDRLEPKLFPEKKRIIGWFSLNTILLMLMVTIGGLTMWFTNREKVTPTQSIQIEDHGKGLENQGGEWEKSTNHQDSRSSNIFTNDNPADIAIEDVVNIEDQPVTVQKQAQHTPHQIDPKPIKNSTATTEINPKFSNSNITQTLTNTEEKIEPKKISDLESAAANNTKKVTIQAAEIAAIPIDNIHSNRIHGPNPEKVFAAELPQVPDHKTKTEIIETDDKKYLIKTEYIDSANVVSRVYKKELPQDDMLDMADQNVAEKASLANNSKSPKSNILNGIMEKNNAENTPIKIKKKSMLSYYAATNIGIKAAYPTMAGVMGLEWMQELSSKFSIIVGMRYKLNSLTANVADSMLNFYDMRVDSISPNQSNVTMYFTQSQKNYKVTQLNVIQIPIYVNYDIVKKFSMQLGLNLDYLISSKHQLTNEWTTNVTTTEPLTNVEIPAWYGPTETPYSITNNDFNSKFGLGLHVGAQYFITNRLYARMAYDQLLKNYYSGTLKNALGPYSKSPTIQIGLGFSLRKTKE